MKKFLFLVLICSTSMVAQNLGFDVAKCNITATSDIIVGEEATFSFPSNAQCSQCYDWDVSGDASIVPAWDDKTRFVTVVPGSGSFTLTMTYFDETGCHTCSKTFTAVEPGCDFEPIFVTKFDCSPQGTGLVKLDNDDLDDVVSVTYVFEPFNNYNASTNTFYFNNFQFIGGGTGIEVTNEPFTANFSYDPATCDDYITFGVTIEFANGSICEDISENFDIFVSSGGGQQPVINLFPNPAIHSTNLELQNMQGRTLEVQMYTLSGEMVQKDVIGFIDSNSFQKELLLPETSSNLLFLKIIESGVLIDTQKIILQQ